MFKKMRISYNNKLGGFLSSVPKPGGANGRRGQARELAMAWGTVFAGRGCFTAVFTKKNPYPPEAKLKIFFSKLYTLFPIFAIIGWYFLCC
jgi:hypothetical protein